LDRIVPLKAEWNNEVRFAINNDDKPVDMSGIWEMNFSGGSDDDQYVGKGIFEQSGNNLSGTMRTTTGDYRYLEGVVDGDDFKLSVFDGAHAFLFKGKVNDSTLNGVFYSGNHWKKNFTAKRNEAYELPSANTLTYLKEGYEKFAFSFPDENGTQISLEDERFKDKVTVVQIMGSWCPNCLDESKYYTKYLLENSDKDVEFIALAFEVAKTPEKAFQRINRLKDRIGIEYPIVLAQYGGSNKKKAQEKLPMLNHVLSYPTSIFIDKKGNVRKIHTGFNGPATGQKYIDFKNEFESFIDQLLSE
jgi:thiol-disulfide isomerase/thioredoxin